MSLVDAPGLDDLDARTRAARLLKAARDLGGFSSVERLAEAISEHGLGDRTLRALERGRRLPSPSELRRIAGACGLHETFFYAAYSEADTFASRLRRLRELRGMSHADLVAVMAERGTDFVAAAEIGAWEDGVLDPPPASIRGILAMVLEAPPSWFDIAPAVGRRAMPTRQELTTVERAYRWTFDYGDKVTELLRLTALIAVRRSPDDTAARVDLKALYEAAIEWERETRVARLAASSAARDLDSARQQHLAETEAGESSRAETMAAEVNRLMQGQVEAEARWEDFSEKADEAAYALDRAVHDRALALAERLMTTRKTPLGWKLADAWRAAIAEARGSISTLENQANGEWLAYGEISPVTARVLEDMHHLFAALLAAFVLEPRRMPAPARTPYAFIPGAGGQNVRIREAQIEAYVNREAEAAEQLEERATTGRRPQRPAPPAPASRRGQRRRS